MNSLENRNATKRQVFLKRRGAVPKIEVLGQIYDGKALIFQEHFYLPPLGYCESNGMTVDELMVK